MEVGKRDLVGIDRMKDGKTNAPDNEKKGTSKKKKSVRGDPSGQGRGKIPPAQFSGKKTLKKNPQEDMVPVLRRENVPGRLQTGGGDAKDLKTEKGTVLFKRKTYWWQNKIRQELGKSS